MGLKLDGIATNEQLDSSGEILNVKGHDITDLVEGRGVLNWEHEKGPDDIIGSITYAKKILSEDDIENDREQLYWDLSGGPYVYIIAELFEDEEHPGAVACAAMVRYFHKRKEKMFIGFSIEGQTLEREGHRLERSVGRRVAFTLRPCNKSALMGVFEDEKMTKLIEKYEREDTIIRSFQVDPLLFDDPWMDLQKSVDILKKTLTAGNYNVPPAMLTGGAALQVEDRSMRNRVKAALRDWDRTRPLKEAIKAALPEVSDQYVDHFTNLAEDISLKKGMPVPKLLRIGPEHSDHFHANDAQKKLIDGLYIDPAKQFNPRHTNFSADIIRSRNDNGDMVLLKPNTSHTAVGDLSKDPPPQLGPSESAHNATHYYNLANDFFGMGNHVPVTTHVYHPETKMKYQAMEHIPDAKTPFMMKPEEYHGVFDKAKENGTLHKLFLMDEILGAHSERHDANILIGKGGHIYHIDNDTAFNPDMGAGGAYLTDSDGSDYGVDDDLIHVDSKKWLDSLDPKELAHQMAKHGINKERIQHSVYALKTAQKMSSEGATMKDIHDMIHINFDNTP